MSFAISLDRLDDGSTAPRAAIYCDECEEDVGRSGLVIAAGRVVDGEVVDDPDAEIVGFYCDEACRQAHRQERDDAGSKYFGLTLGEYLADLMLFARLFGQSDDGTDSHCKSDQEDDR